MDRKADAVVVGAGPAGARCAELLAASGHSVLMIEKDTFAGETNVCGGLLDASFAAELNLPNSMIKEIDRWVCHFRSRAVAVETRKISFARKEFDRHLADRAISKGAELLSSTRAISAERDGEGIVLLTINRKTQEKESVQGRIAIFADGPSTLAKRFFGIGFRGNARNTAIGAICEFTHDGSGDSYDLFFDSAISARGYGWVIPKPDHLNVGIMCQAGEISTEHLKGFFHKQLTAFPELEWTKQLRFASGLIPLAPSDTLSSERVLVVGDAAGMVDAIWGDGLKYGLRAAECAARAASEGLLQGRYDANSLAKYDTLWKRTPEYAVLRKAKLLTDTAFHLQRVWPDVYESMVSFGVSHRSLQRLLCMQGKKNEAI